MSDVDTASTSRKAARARSALKWALGITIALYFIPFGRLLLWPLTCRAIYSLK